MDELEIADYQKKAREVVETYIRAHHGKHELPEFSVFHVWFCKTLQNWKALLSSTLPDDMYYEVTYNGDKDEIYLDAYHKVDNVCITSAGVPVRLEVTHTVDYMDPKGARGPRGQVEEELYQKAIEEFRNHPVSDIEDAGENVVNSNAQIASLRTRRSSTADYDFE
jgi:hypothetical protein